MSSCPAGPARRSVLGAGAYVGDGARAVDSSTAVHSFSPSAPAAASTTIPIRVGWKRRGVKYNVRHVEAEKREKWCREMHVVDVHDGGSRYTCECGLFEHMGMLCCHAIKVLISFGAAKDTACACPEEMDGRRQGQLAVAPPPLLERSRASVIVFLPLPAYGTALEFVQLGDSNVDAFDRAMDILNAVKVELSVLAPIKDGKSLVDQTQVGESANPTQALAAGGSQPDDMCSEMFVSTECGSSSVLGEAAWASVLHLFPN